MQRTHRLQANGLMHHVRDSGEESAPAAVLLHGFPDSSAVWDKVTPALVAAGYRVLAPDLRGFGETDIADTVAAYAIETGALRDVIGLMDRLGVRKAHLVGHDFGAFVAWALAAERADRFWSLTALSVGHPKAFLSAGIEQKLRSYYMVVHQFRGVCESIYRLNNWMLLRRNWTAHADVEAAIALLSRPGRLTAGLNWYRANISFNQMLGRAQIGIKGDSIIRIPTLGVWSRDEKYLVEAQMTASAPYVDAPWTYERIDGAGHWIPADAPEALSKLLIRHWRAA